MGWVGAIRAGRLRKGHAGLVRVGAAEIDAGGKRLTFGTLEGNTNVAGSRDRRAPSPPAAEPGA